MTFRIIYSIIFLALGLQILNGQHRASVHFTEEDGLPGNLVYDVISDRDGILWISTNNGIARYDGDEFTHIYDSEGRPLLNARALARGSNNEIYAGMYNGGLAIVKNDVAGKIIHNSNNETDRIRKLYYSNFHKLLFVGTADGLFILKNDSLVEVPFEPGWKWKRSIVSFSGSDSLLFFTAADCGLFKVEVSRTDAENIKVQKISYDGSYASLVYDGKILGSTLNNIYIYPIDDPSSRLIYPVKDKTFFIWSFSRYKNGEFLIGGIGDERFTADVLLFNPEKRTYRRLISERNIQTVNSFYYDDVRDIIWIARDNGLYAVFESPFESFETPQNISITNIGFAGDSLLILTSEGIYLKQEDNIIPLVSKERIVKAVNLGFNRFVPMVRQRQYIFDNRAHDELVTLIRDRNKLYVSTQRGAISVPDLKTYLPFAVGTFKTSASGGAYSFVRYSPLKYFPIYDSLEWITPDGPGGNARNIDEIIESNGTYYCRSQTDGLYVIRNNIVYRLSDENSEIDNNLTGIDTDSEGYVWCSSGDGNLFQVGFSDSAYILKKIDLLKAGLNGNLCRWIRFNGDYLFAGSNKGLNIISRKELFTASPMFSYSYDEHKGYNFASASNTVSGPSGKVYANTEDAIVCIDTAFKPSGKHFLRIFNLKVSGQDFLRGDLESKNLSYQNNQISFIFKTLKYPSSHNLRYRYKINDAEWIRGNQVFLQSLSQGNYDILMEGYDTEDMSVLTDTLSFTIRPPFVKSAWFVFPFFIIIILTFYTYLRFRIKILNKQHEEKTRLVIQNSELRLRSLQIQMNPHFIFNALNAIQSFIMEKNTEDSMTYLNDLSGIIRTNLMNATEEYIFLSQEIAFLKKYIQIERMRFDKKMNVEFEETQTNTLIKIPPMLIQPLIENAINHGIRNKEGQGMIKISFREEVDVLSVIVEDNGAGRKFAESTNLKSHNGISLKIIKQRLDLLNGKYHTDKHKITFSDLEKDGVASGTRVSIFLLARN